TGEDLLTGAYQRLAAQVHVDVVVGRRRTVDDQVVARTGVVAREPHGAAARRGDPRATASEHVEALMAPSATELIGVGPAEVMATADREQMVVEGERLGGDRARPQRVDAWRSGSGRKQAVPRPR